jgi:hypothetical protein
MISDMCAAHFLGTAYLQELFRNENSWTLSTVIHYAHRKRCWPWKEDWTWSTPAWQNGCQWCFLWSYKEASYSSNVCNPKPLWASTVCTRKNLIHSDQTISWVSFNSQFLMASHAAANVKRLQCKCFVGRWLQCHSYWHVPQWERAMVWSTSTLIRIVLVWRFCRKRTALRSLQHFQGASVTLHIILLDVGDTIYNTHSEAFQGTGSWLSKELGSPWDKIHIKTLSEDRRFSNEKRPQHRWSFNVEASI